MYVPDINICCMMKVANDSVEINTPKKITTLVLLYDVIS